MGAMGEERHVSPDCPRRAQRNKTIKSATPGGRMTRRSLSLTFNSLKHTIYLPRSPFRARDQSEVKMAKRTHAEVRSNRAQGSRRANDGAGGRTHVESVEGDVMADGSRREEATRGQRDPHFDGTDLQIQRIGLQGSRAGPAPELRAPRTKRAE